MPIYGERYSLKKSSLPNLHSPQQLHYFGMADRLPVQVPEQYTRAKNTAHTGEQHPIPENKKFGYGTAGFRDKAEVLPFIAFRLGFLAALRARKLNKAIGLMITASHNPACDNGLKVVDPLGEMLASDWEKYATELVNTSDDQLPTAVRALQVQIDPAPNATNARVLCGMDTRASGSHLTQAAKAGAALLGVEFIDFGILTTPQLHYVVRVTNDPAFGPEKELGYYTRFGDAFKELYKLTTTADSFDKTLHIDCANGVGAQKMRILERFLTDGAMQITYHNEEGELNAGCGADFVKIERKLPSTFESVFSTSRCASFDGDTDRLVYFRRDGSTNNIVLLDGDKIALLLAKYLLEQIHAANLGSELKVGIVQTAYANGSSTKYITDVLGLPAIYVPTGVKHLHHEAVKYDVGIYFEANGHGTVCFSDKFHGLVKDATAADVAKLRLKLFSQLINEVVGDAMTDLLAVEVILRHYNWTIDDWNEKLYTDAPNKQIKVPVADRSVFKTTFEETTLLEPVGMQEKIDNLVNAMGGLRAFVRPSGTENIVRVYVEAPTDEGSDSLGQAIADLIRKM